MQLAWQKSKSQTRMLFYFSSRGGLFPPIILATITIICIDCSRGSGLYWRARMATKIASRTLQL